MAQLVVGAVSWLLAMVFAIVWGAHIFETAVIYWVVASEPPKSLIEWNATPYALKVPGFWQRLVGSLYTIASIALIVAIGYGARVHPALIVSCVCAFIHLTMNVAVMLPINTKLGYYSAGKEASSDPQALKTLVRRWGQWNSFRLCVEAVGLIAALLAFRAS